MNVKLLEAAASDLAVVNAARVSFAEESRMEPIPDHDAPPIHLNPFDTGPIAHMRYRIKGFKLSDKDAGLIRFLIRERHGTPFEHGFFKFRVEAPIFVFREWHRHRAGHSYNEMSGRYVELEKRFYDPKEFRTQIGKPGAYEYVVLTDPSLIAATRFSQQRAWKATWDEYQYQLGLGIAKEQARAVLPVGIYSQMIWSCNPRSLMHFLGLRNMPNAQQEIRDLAAQAESALEKHMPVTYAAFIANERKAP